MVDVLTAWHQKSKTDLAGVIFKLYIIKNKRWVCLKYRSFLKLHDRERKSDCSYFCFHALSFILSVVTYCMKEFRAANSSTMAQVTTAKFLNNQLCCTEHSGLHELHPPTPTPGGILVAKRSSWQNTSCRIAETISGWGGHCWTEATTQQSELYRTWRELQTMAKFFTATGLPVQLTEVKEKKENLPTALFQKDNGLFRIVGPWQPETLVHNGGHFRKAMPISETLVHNSRRFRKATPTS